MKTRRVILLFLVNWGVSHLLSTFLKFLILIFSAILGSLNGAYGLCYNAANSICLNWDPSS